MTGEVEDGGRKEKVPNKIGDLAEGGSKGGGRECGGERELKKTRSRFLSGLVVLVPALTD